MASSMLMQRPIQDKNIIFTRKLEGAHARLFAVACHRYVEAVVYQSIDTDSTLPVWCTLCPQHRLKLVKEVMVGLLCEKEPLPQTEEHFLAYMGIWRFIHSNVECELDEQYDYLWCDDEDSKRIIDEISASCPPEEGMHNQQQVPTGIESEHEKNERLKKETILSKIASKAKKKLAKKAQNCNIDEEQQEEEEEEDGRDNNEEEKLDGDMSMTMESYFKYMSHDKFIFEGGPPPQESRAYLKPMPSDDAAYSTYKWRILCDDAFQENKVPTMCCPVPLSFLNFNWKYDKGFKKWNRALRLLMIYSDVVNYFAIREKIFPLHFGEIDDEEFANPKHHKRIVNIYKTSNKLRSEYEEIWDPAKNSLDQRCIFAVCSTGIYTSGPQKVWTTEFLMRLQQKNINILHLGNYQARYEIYCEIETFEEEGLKVHMSYYDNKSFPHPSEYEPTDFTLAGYYYERCHAEGCRKWKDGNLSKCSRWYVILASIHHCDSFIL